MKRLLGFAALLLTLVPAVAEARTVHSDIVVAPAGICQLRYGGGIACFGDEAVPAQYTDGYLWMKKRGRVHRGDAGGLVGPANDRPVTLRVGDRWNNRGVRCRKIPGAIKCSNGKHGFRLAKYTYKVW